MNTNVNFNTQQTSNQYPENPRKRGRSPDHLTEVISNTANKKIHTEFPSTRTENNENFTDIYQYNNLDTSDDHTNTVYHPFENGFQYLSGGVPDQPAADPVANLYPPLNHTSINTPNQHPIHIYRAVVNPPPYAWLPQNLNRVPYPVSMTFSDGTEFDGTFISGTRNDISRTIGLENGGTYTGDAVNNIPNGQGEMSLPNGDVLRGSFVNGCLHGHGKYYTRGRLRYSGDFSNGIPHGSGELFDDIGHYKGDFSNGSPHGYGRMDYNNGSCHLGRFLNGIPQATE